MLSETIDVRAWFEDKARKTPFWAISGAFHALLLAALGLIQFAVIPMKSAVPVPITISGRLAPKVEQAERPRAELSRAGDPGEPQAFIAGAVESDHDEVDIGNPKDHETYAAVEDEVTNITGFPGLERGLGRDPSKSNVGASPSLGVGSSDGAPGGTYGKRGKGGSRNLVKKRNGGGGTDAVVEAGLRWLARHQGADGGWHAEAFAQCCAPGTPCAGNGYGQFDVGLTGLALLAFLGDGHTQTSRDVYIDQYTQRKVRFGDVVRRAEEFLLRVQDGDGCLGPRTGEFMYNHAIASLALAEAFGMSRAASLRAPTERAIRFLVTAQNPYRGWRYSVQPGDNDTSVTGWCVMALKAATVSGLDPPRTSFDNARAWIDSVTDEAGMVGYTGKGKFGVVIPGKNDAWRDHPAMTAVGLLCRVYTDHGSGDAVLDKHARAITADLPRWETPAVEKPIDFYYWYYGALALFQYDAPDGRCWRAWNDAMRQALMPHQARGLDGCGDGSWDPRLDRWGAVGGRVYATAINTLTMEVYTRYLKVGGHGK